MQTVKLEAWVSHHFRVFLDCARQASRGLTMHFCDRSLPPWKCNGIVCLVPSLCCLRSVASRNHNLPEMFSEIFAFKQESNALLHAVLHFYSRQQMFLLVCGQTSLPTLGKSKWSAFCPTNTDWRLTKTDSSVWHLAKEEIRSNLHHEVKFASSFH